MKRFATLGVERKVCPFCGGQITVTELFQYSHDYKIGKSGRISKRYTVQDCGSMEATVAGCSCGANWGVGEFDITSEGRFMDYKYNEEAE